MTGDYVEEQKLPISRGFLIFILGLLATIDPFSIDFYLPAFSAIAKDLGTTTAKVSLSISSYFIGLAIGQISYGPVIDRFGRKRPLYFGLAGFIVTSAGCMMAHSIEALILLRFLQALSGGVAGIGAFAMVRDFFPVKESAKIFSMLLLIIGISPLIAPSIGGFIAGVLGWQWVFIVLIFIVAVMLVLVYFFLPEGHRPDPSVSLRVRPIVTTFYGILRNRQFITCTLSGSFAFTTLFIYVAGSPVIFMDLFGMSTRQFSLIFTVLSCCFLASSQLNIWLLKRFHSLKIFQVAAVLQLLISIVFLVFAIANATGLVTTMVLLLLVLSCIGSIMPNATALALAPFKQNVGSASALMGFLQLGISSIISSFIGLLNAKSLMPVAVLLVATTVMSVLILFAGRRRIVIGG